MSSCQNEQFDYPGRDEDLKQSLRLVSETVCGDMPSSSVVNMSMIPPLGNLSRFCSSCGSMLTTDCFGGQSTCPNGCFQGFPNVSDGVSWHITPAPQPEIDTPTHHFQKFCISILKILRDRVDSLVTRLEDRT